MTELELKRNNFYVRSYRKIRKWRYYTRVYYEILNFLYRKHSDWRCINYGYLPLNDSDSLPLEPEEESERLALSLYQYTASKLPLQGLDVLEVGSGRGGGASFVHRYHNPHSMTGLELTRNGVKFCYRNYQSPGLKFIIGNALEMPFEEHSFDVVMSVESFHALPDRIAFIHEMMRVLKPGGYFICSDVIEQVVYEIILKLLDEVGMTINSVEMITDRVMAAMHQDDERKMRKINETVPTPFRKAAEFFAGTTGSYPYLKLKCGESIYYNLVAQTPNGH